MVKYLNILACSALAMFIASPASAGIINLYDLRNFLYYGSTNLGKGIDGESDPYVPSCDASKGEFDSLPSNMTCQSVNKGSITCYRNCTCSSEFKYDDSNCPSAQRFVRSGQTCNGLYNSCSCSDEALNLTTSTLNAVTGAFDGFVTYTSGDNNVTCKYLVNPSCKNGRVQLNYLPSGTQMTTTLDGHYLVIYSDENPLYYELFASTNNKAPGTIYCINTVSVQNEFKNAVSLDASKLTQSCAEVLTSTDSISGRSFSYYSGNCSEDNTKLCSTESVPCVDYGSVEFSFYRPNDNTLGNRSCGFVIGCKEGSDGNGNMCYSSVSNGMTYTPYTDQGKTCYNVTGCSTGYCSTDSSLLSSIKSASTLGYTLTSSSSCDGIKIKHPLEDKYMCIQNTL